MTDTFDQRVQALAERQDSLITRDQAFHLGGTKRMIDHRLATGRWRRMAEGVYAIGGAAPTPTFLLRAATLHLPAAFVSHQSAAELQSVDFVPRGLRVLTVPKGTTNRSPFARVHESLWLPDRHVIEINSFRTTDRIRTLLDLSAVLGWGRMERVLDDQLSSGQVAVDPLVAAYETWTRRGRRRSAGFAALLDARCGAPPARSVLERSFLGLIRAAGLLVPDQQFRLDWLPPRPGTVDFAYPQLRLIVEVDGRRWHSRDADFDHDRRRDVEAALRGWTVLRFTWRQVHHEPAYVLDALTRALAQHRHLSA